MDPSALIKARKRLVLAKKSAQALTGLLGEEFWNEWFTFLVACNGVYTSLKRGANASPQSLQWFGKVDRIRRETPLYQYLFQARHDELHGLEPVAESVPTAVIFEDEADNLKPIEGEGQSLLTRLLVISKEAIGFVRVTGQDPFIKLLPVTGRQIVFNPPLEHKGHIFGLNAPEEMAHFMVEHLETIMAEAEGLS
jgi:hypothetical protein